ncbi:hypothetical protein C6I20_13815 [Aeromicrobium sp. A1-2]|uniref:hypothetical protein n=1 Tax=Aeromicrobium sp. A1-2 TaxID=2107713 RepID=UPI000E4EDF16|nr:hypothetical protein [Aeromicrobium sp. A1-2]AXT86152.1 hypothetical protein C6I20_13815 [Aeromicrobium sp. A1-2]
MKFRQGRSLGSQANASIGNLASRVDDQTGDVARRAAGVITVAVRVLRIPTALLAWASVPFILMTLALGLLTGGGVGTFFILSGLAMAVVNGAFWIRRHSILRAADDPDRLATELGIMISLSDRIDETRGALSQIAGGDGWRVFDRLRGVWGGMTMTGRWIDGIGDLPRAKYFAPPKIGTTVTIAVAALWLIPISVVVALFALIGTIAGSL